MIISKELGSNIAAYFNTIQVADMIIRRELEKSLGEYDATTVNNWIKRRATAEMALRELNIPVT